MSTFAVVHQSAPEKIVAAYQTREQAEISVWMLGSDFKIVERSDEHSEKPDNQQHNQRMTNNIG
jgi:hypothetical protein